MGALRAARLGCGACTGRGVCGGQGLSSSASRAPTSAPCAGVTTEEQLLSPENAIQPDYYMDNLAELLSVKEGLKVAA